MENFPIKIFSSPHSQWSQRQPPGKKEWQKALQPGSRGEKASHEFKLLNVSSIQPGPRQSKPMQQHFVQYTIVLVCKKEIFF